jgi:hypothetical protein
MYRSSKQVRTSEKTLPGTSVNKGAKKGPGQWTPQDDVVMVGSNLSLEYVPQPRAHLWLLESRVPVGVWRRHEFW